jgi:Flp pilus assembly protein TadG
MWPISKFITMNIRAHPVNNRAGSLAYQNRFSQAGTPAPAPRESSQSLIMFVMFMFMLMLFVGLGVDMGFAYITRARLSKAVDAACLIGVRSYSSADAGSEADGIARATFAANYPKSGRDVAAVTPNVVFGSENNNITLNVTAATTINTFFIRVMGAIPGMPNWDTLPVSSTAQATRPNLIMSLVLDRSGSMGRNGGAAKLPGAVSNFIDLFDDGLDRASMSSFSYAARADVTMKHNFKQEIKTDVNAMIFDGWTASEPGLTNGLVQNLSANPVGGEKVVRVIVFFTDGMANTFYYTFNCGPRNIAQNTGELYDPVTGARANSGCTVPGTLPAINGGTVDTSSCVAMNNEAEDRAEWIAHLARSQGIIIYAIGMGDPNEAGECGGAVRALNPAFLKRVANTPDSTTYDTNQPVGDYAIADNPAELDQVFQGIGAKILSRLSR